MKKIFFIISAFVVLTSCTKEAPVLERTTSLIDTNNLNIAVVGNEFLQGLSGQLRPIMPNGTTFFENAITGIRTGSVQIPQANPNKSNVIFLMEGTNDVYAGVNESVAYNNYASLVSRARSAGWYVVAMPALKKGTPSLNRVVDLYSSLLINTNDTNVLAKVFITDIKLPTGEVFQDSTTFLVTPIAKRYLALDMKRSLWKEL